MGQLKCPSSNEKRDKMWYVPAMKYYSAMKRRGKERLPEGFL
jgi:hypothetical protein